MNKKYVNSKMNIADVDDFSKLNVIGIGIIHINSSLE